MSRKHDINKEIENEVYCGTLPVLPKERKYGFIDALLVLSGYCIATWSYTQGSYLATLVGFKQLLIGAFLAAIFMLMIYQLPVIMSARYGIDIWIWLRSVFGPAGNKIVTIIIIVVNFPWYAVCCELFADSMENLLGLFGIQLFNGAHLILSLSCVVIGTVIALRGVGTITWTTRILVPLLLLVGVAVVIVGFTSVPMDVIWNYQPELAGDADKTVNYVLSIEANFAFVITLVGGMAEVPRLCRSEKSGYYAGVLGQGAAGSFFVVVGAVMAIAMQYVTGKMVDDPTLMMATLSAPILGLSSLLLVAFANIGTQAVGSYIYGVMLKSTFKKSSYKVLVLVLGLYVAVLCVWGKITEYFGSFLTIGACVYAPLAALLFVDFFLVRKQKIDLKSAYELPGHTAYRYTGGFNIVGIICLALGFGFTLLIFDPINVVIHNKILFMLTPTFASFLFTGILYYLLCKIPFTRDYVICKGPDKKPFDRAKTPPRQNLFFMPFIWLICKFITAPYKLKIDKHNMDGIKPPFLVYGSHNSFMDFYVTPLALKPYRANYISELEGFEAFGEWIYRQVGCLGTRKFINDQYLIKNIIKVIKRGDVMVIYPEARYANVGTNSHLTPSIAKLAKLLKVPVVTINMQGNYLQQPIWNLKERKGARLHADLKCVVTQDEIGKLSVDEILSRISKELTYDEYKYQLENKMSIGFVGSPNIGSVALNGVKDSNEFKAFANVFADGDRIFFISSIFGGTGAAGFPIIVKNIRQAKNIDAKNKAFLQRAPIGGLTVLPYFSLMESDDKNDKRIDNADFVVKTQSALEYYNNTLTGNGRNAVNAIFYLGDHGHNAPYAYDPGDKRDQHDPAHLIEMVGAMALFKFLSLSDS